MNIRTQITIGTAAVFAAITLAAVAMSGGVPDAAAEHPPTSVPTPVPTQPATPAGSSDAVPVSTTPAGPEAPVRVALYGDSLAWEARSYVDLFADDANIQVVAHVYSGTSICDWFDEMADTTAEFDPDISVMSFVGNPFSACMDGRTRTPAEIGAKYLDDARHATDLVTINGGQVAWVIPPTPSFWPNYTTHHAVPAAYRTVAGEHPDAHVTYGGAHIAPDGVYVETLPCLAFEPCTGHEHGAPEGHNIVRTTADGIHFCPSALSTSNGLVDVCMEHSSGALRYALALIDAAHQFRR